MNVYDAIGKIPDEVRREEAHITGQADQINLRLLQRRYHLGIMILAYPAFGRNQLRMQTSLSGRLQTGSVGTIRNYDRDFGVKPSSLNGICNGLKI